jgi:adenylate cyclase
MRGKERPERLFALLGDEAVAQSERFRKFEDAHAQLMAAMGAGDLATAHAKLDACRQLGWVELDGLLDSYAYRLGARK